jgi:hypothetical protein
MQQKRAGGAGSEGQTSGAFSEEQSFRALQGSLDKRTETICFPEPAADVIENVLCMLCP